MTPVAPRSVKSVSYLVMLERHLCCSAHCKSRFISDADQS